MLTPQEVQDKKFVKAVFGGYDMVTVDEFLEELTNDYTALFKENTVLKNKLKVLVDTVEEYRTVDESMRRALLGAQKIARNMVQEAKQKSEKLLDSANKSAQSRKLELDNELIAEKRRLEAAKLQTAKFIEIMRGHFVKQVELLESLPQIAVPDPDLKVNEQNLNALEIDENLRRSVADEISAVDAESDGEVSFEEMDLEALEAYGQEEQAESSEDDTELFEIKLPPSLQELPDDALQVDDTGEIEQPINYDGLQFGENFRVGK